MSAVASAEQEEFSFTWAAWVEAFQIFSRYCNGGKSNGNIGGEHDVIYVWPDQEISKEEDKARLKLLGWGYDEGLPAWVRVV